MYIKHALLVDLDAMRLVKFEASFIDLFLDGSATYVALHIAV